MDPKDELLNQDTITFSSVHSQPIVLQNCQNHSPKTQHSFYFKTHHQFDTLCEDTHSQLLPTHQSSPKPQPSFKGLFTTPEKSLSPNLQPHPLSTLHSSSTQKPQNSKFRNPKRKIPLVRPQYKRNLRFQKEQFAAMFNYMSQAIGQRIAQESGIATTSFLKRKKQTERNNKQIVQFMEMFDYESLSSWSSQGGRKRKNWFRRVSKRDVRTVMAYLKELDKQVDIAKVQDNLQKVETNPKQEARNTTQYQKDIIQHLAIHSLFLENLPSKITYSQLEKFLQSFGEISHFLILDSQGRRKANNSVSVQERQNKYKFNRFSHQQNNIIGFVQFFRSQSVQIMLNLMKEKKLRYFVKSDVDVIKENEQAKDTKIEDSSRKIYEDCESIAIQEDEQKKRSNRSRKIYARQVNWEQMLKPLERKSPQNWNKKKMERQQVISQKAEQKQFDTEKYDTTEIQQPSRNFEHPQRQQIQQEGWQSLNEESKQQSDQSQKKAIGLEKLNMLRLKIKLIKSVPIVKVEPLDGTMNKNQDGIFSSKPQKDREERSGQNNSQQPRVQQQQNLAESSQTNIANIFSNHTNRSSNPIPIVTERRCEDCESRQKRNNRRSIEKQIQITVGVRYSSQVPIKSALGTFFIEQKRNLSNEIQTNIPVGQKIIQSVQNNMAKNHIIEEESKKQKFPSTLQQNLLLQAVADRDLNSNQLVQPIQLQNQNVSHNNQKIQGQKPTGVPKQMGISESILTQQIEAKNHRNQTIPQENHLNSNTLEILCQKSHILSSSSHQSERSASSSPIYSNQSSVAARKKPSEKQKNEGSRPFFEYSLWESDQDNGEVTKNPSKQLSNTLSIQNKLKITERLLQNGLSASPLITMPKNQEKEEGEVKDQQSKQNKVTKILNEEHKIKEKFINKQSKSATSSSRSSRSSRSSSFSRSSSKDSKSKSRQNEESFESKNSKKSRRIFHQRKSRQNSNNDRYGEAFRSNRYQRDRGGQDQRVNQREKIRDQPTNYRQNELDVGRNYSRNSNKNQRKQSGYREDSRQNKFQDRPYQANQYKTNSRFDQREQKKISNFDRGTHSNNFKIRNDKRQPFKYESKPQGYKSSNPQEDSNTKRDQRKQSALKKWKYSEYVQEQKISDKKKDEKQDDGEY